jgi:phytoene dehydrogenase-like protein
MHWLGGSKKGSSLNKLWHHVGALDESVKIRYGEPFVEFDFKGTPIRLYRDVERTEKELLELSPADRKEIKSFCNNIRKMKGLSSPIADIKKVKTTKKRSPSIGSLFILLRALSVVRKFSKTSREDYVKRFSHPGIRELIRAIPGEKQGMSMLFLTMGALASGDGGFPEGGSLPFVGRMVDTFTSLGGKILCGTRASRVIVENGEATGTLAGDKYFPADAVIIAADTMQIDHLFEIPIKVDWLEEMRKKTRPTAAILVSLGINADLTKYPKRPILNFENPICIADQNYSYLLTNNYATDAVYSPQGKTAMTMQLPGDTYDFWKKAKDAGFYQEEKDNLAKQIIKALVVQMPETNGNIEICDIATPLTYERYCDNWKGSWMTQITAELDVKPYPPVIKGLNRVYFAGQRMRPPGGLPPALMSARAAVQYLCRDTDTLFISE